MKLRRRQFLHLAAGAAALPAISRAARAQDYPSRLITVVVAFPAGGPTDVLARILADHMKGTLGQPVVIDNRPGANGTIGAASVVKAPPDGHTLLFTPNASLTVNPYLQKSFPFRPLTALAPINTALGTALFLAVHPSVPARNVAELVEHARKNPGKLSYGSAGVGSGHQIVGELLKQKTGIEITHIPYRGLARAISDLVAGHIQIGFAGLTLLGPHAAAGTVRILAAVEDKRYAELPDVPTIAETYPGVAIPVTWFGFLGPVGMPKSVIEKLNNAISAALNNSEVIAKLKQQRVIVIAEGPEALARRMQQEIVLYEALLPSIGIQPE